MNYCEKCNLKFNSSSNKCKCNCELTISSDSLSSLEIKHSTKQLIKNDENSFIKEELVSIKNKLKSITYEINNLLEKI